MEKAICNRCGAEFNTDAELAEHNAEMHGMTSENEQNGEGMTQNALTCSVCNMSFLTREEMEHHTHEVHEKM